MGLTWSGQLLLRSRDDAAARDAKLKELRLAAFRFANSAQTLRIGLVDSADWRDRLRGGRGAAFLLHDRTALPLERLLAAAIDAQKAAPALVAQVDALVETAGDLFGALGQDDDTYTAASEKYQETFSAVVQAITARAEPKQRWWRRVGRSADSPDHS